MSVEADGEGMSSLFYFYLKSFFLFLSVFWGQTVGGQLLCVPSLANLHFHSFFINGSIFNVVTNENCRRYRSEQEQVTTPTQTSKIHHQLFLFRFKDERTNVIPT